MVDGAIRGGPELVGAYITPTFPLGTKPWRVSRRFVAQNGLGVATQTDRTIAWANGHTTQFRSAHEPGDIVGESWSDLEVDEAGRLLPEAWDYMEAMTVAHDALEFRLGTPRGKGSRFYSDYLRGLDIDGNSPVISGKPAVDASGRYISFRAPSTLSPLWTDARLEVARTSMHPLMFRQEILAEFLDEAASPFGDWQRWCTGRRDGAPHPDGAYVLGVDVAKHLDFTRVRAFRCDGARYRLVNHWSPQGAWPTQIKAIAQIARSWGALVCIDATGIGDVVVDELRALGVSVEPYVFTAASKAALIENYAHRLQGGQVELLPREEDPIGWQEHEDFLADPIVTRGLVKSDVAFRYGHPDGKHDDTVIANALGVWAAANGDWASSEIPVVFA